MFRISSFLVCLLFSASIASGQQPLPNIDSYTEGLERQEGYFPLYWDAAKARLLLEVSRWNEDFLYLPSHATGLGTSRLLLDRGEIGDESIARFEKTGDRVLLVLRNSGFRAQGISNEALIRSVDESFPHSTVAAFPVLAAEGERVVVDFTSFAVSDVTDLSGRLKRADQGNYRLDRDRSHVFLPRTRAFPENTEIEAALTFSSDQPGSLVRQRAPDGRWLTIRIHHSLVRLPDSGYRPRVFDPRVGLFPVSFYDFSKPFDEDYVTRYAIRHRLIKTDTSLPLSDPVEPIVYYMDRAIPEPYRSAFKEGALWWNKVFESAGFRNAVRIEDMPPGMDPLDARYHVIQWVHRTEAGSSIGPSFVDPRTGEIVKAAVRMDSHRSLVDFDIYAGAATASSCAATADPLLSEGGMEAWIAQLDPRVSAEEFVMARRRQHSAHEVGHTLGLAHNFVAASYGRASVMDYPAPLIRLTRGEVDLSDAYRDGPGAYDEFAIRWAYSQFSEEEEAESLDGIVDDAMERGLKFITNPDESASSSFPEATTWINGADAVEELERILLVRRTLIDRFDEAAVREGEPMAWLNRRFARVYLHHRFVLRAAAKAVGGMEFRYALRGDPAAPTEIVDPAQQRRALELLLEAIQPPELAVPDQVLDWMAPRPFGHRPDSLAFASPAAPAFDQIGIARTLCSMVVSELLNPRRSARLVAFSARRAELPGLEEVVRRLIEGTWQSTSPGPAALKRVAQRAVLDELIDLAGNQEATVEVRAGAEWGLRLIQGILAAVTAGDDAEEAHYGLALADVQRFLDRQVAGTERSGPSPPPPGTPIGKRQ